MDAEDDLAGPRLRVRNVLDAQHLGAAELVEAQGSHGRESGRVFA